MKIHWIIIMPILMLGVAGNAAITVMEQDVPEADGVKKITVKNDFFEIALVKMGAMATSFKTKYGDKEWLWKGGSGIRDCGKLFMDNFVGEGAYTGEIWRMPYEYVVSRKSDNEVEIKFFGTTKDGRQRFEKVFVFQGDSPMVQVKMTLKNESKDVLTRGLWPKCDLHVGGVKEGIRYFRPYQHGVMETGWDAAKLTNIGDDFVKSPCEGWTAAIQSESQEGLVFLMDYNWLRWLYNCHVCWTLEWMYDEVPLPKEKSWTTEYQMILVKGFRNLAHASTHVVAGMMMENGKETGQSLKITHTLGRSLAGGLKQVELTGKLKEVDSGVSHELPPLQVGDLGWESRSVSQEIKINPDVRVLAEITLKAALPDGKALVEEYSFYFPGITGEKFNLIAGANVPTYSRKAPQKLRTYPKPAEIKYFLNAPPRVMEFRGPVYHVFRVTEAAARAGAEEIAGSYFSFQSWAGGKVTRVPVSYEETLANDLYVLNGVDAQSMTDYGLEMMRDFVKAGGSLMMIGGLFSFDQGGFAGTQLEEVLPVKLAGKGFNLERLEPSAAVKVAPTSRCLKGASWKGRPLCYWRHALDPKEGAWVELTAGGKPIMVCGNYGKGRVAVILATAMGDPQKGETPFWNDPAWTENLEKVMKWLIFGKESL